MEEKLNMVLNFLLAHPDCEEDSEMADMVYLLENVIAELKRRHDENRVDF